MRVFCGFHNLWRLEEEEVKHFIVLRSKKGRQPCSSLNAPNPYWLPSKGEGTKMRHPSWSRECYSCGLVT